MNISQRSRRRTAVAVAVFLTVTLTAQIVYMALHWGDFYALRGIEALEMPVFVAVFGYLGALVAYRHPENPIGWILALVGITRQVAVLDTVVDISIANGTEVTWGLLAIREISPAALTFTLLASVFLIFPTGRLPSKRWRPMIWLVVLIGIFDLAKTTYMAMDARRVLASVATPPPLVPPVEWGPYSLSRHVRPLPEIGWLQASVFVFILLILALGVWVQIHRLRTGPHVVRQQVKWLVPTLLLWALGLAATAPPIGMPFDWIALVVILIPVSVAIAILRYRTLDIDLIINRTLVYGALSVVLAGVYLLGVVVLGGLVRSTIGHDSSISVAASTLLAIALFTPLRNRIQRFVNRRFYRRHYDAEEVLESFAHDISSETDSDEISDRLLDVVQETLQPAGAAVWLRTER